MPPPLPPLHATRAFSLTRTLPFRHHARRPQSTHHRPHAAASPATPTDPPAETKHALPPTATTADDADLPSLSPPPIFHQLPASPAEARGLRRQLRRILLKGTDGHPGTLATHGEDPEGGWRLVDGGGALERAWTFRRFRDAWLFLGAVVARARHAGHVPSVVSSDCFVLVRWTTVRGPSPASSKTPARDDTAQSETGARAPELDGAAAAGGLGLTRLDVRMAGVTASLALSFHPIGVGEENGGLWERSEREKALMAAQRLLRDGRRVESLERGRLRGGAAAAARRRDHGDQGEELGVPPLESSAEGHEASEATTGGEKAGDDGDETPEDFLAGLQRAAKRDIDRAMEGLVGRDWVGMAMKEADGRARADRDARREKARAWRAKGIGKEIEGTEGMKGTG